MSLVSVSELDRVRVLRVEGTDARNAVDSAVLAALLDAIADAQAHEGGRCLILTGSGSSFSTGADEREWLDDVGAARRAELLGQVYEALAACPVPTIAAVTGPCAGEGAEMAAACDLRVADPRASFRFTGAATAHPVGAAKLVGLVGLGTAKDFVLTARTVTADEAAHVGLVQHLTPDGQALAVARELAGQIAAHDREAIRYLKRLFDRFGGATERIAVEGDALLALARGGGDYRTLTAQHRGSGGWPG